MLNQLQFAGMESEPKRPEPRMTPTDLPHSDRPVGMRGSVPDRQALLERQGKMYANRTRWDSAQARVGDEGADYDEDPAPHPSTGLPSWGEIDTHEAPLNMGYDQPPWNLSYHGSARSARVAVGVTKEIPIVGQEGNINTPQNTVSSTRLHEAIENPETRSSPRFPAQFRELPHVYSRGPDASDHTLIDGNHRVSSALMRGEMFQPAKVLTEKSTFDVIHKTGEVANAKRRAEHNPNRNPRSDEKLQELYYGDNY